MHVVPATPEAIERAAALLRSGGLVAFPTETVYGLGALALDEKAVARVFQAKSRPSTNPLIVHVESLAAVSQIAADIPTLAVRLAERFWPGPLTLVLNKAAHLPAALTAGGSTVAVRVPRHPVARALLAAVGAPIAAPSANRSSQLSPTTAEHVAASLGDLVDMILDGGPCEVGIESTVVDVTGLAPIVLRPGLITGKEIALVAEAELLSASQSRGPARSPGQQERHYAPRARLVLAVAQDMGKVVSEQQASHRKVSWLVRETSERPVGRGLVLPQDPHAFAAQLYASLHALDDDSDVIVIELPPHGDAWEAVHDRLRRAASPA